MWNKKAKFENPPFKAKTPHLTFFTMNYQWSLCLDGQLHLAAAAAEQEEAAAADCMHLLQKSCGIVSAQTLPF